MLNERMQPVVNLLGRSARKEKSVWIHQANQMKDANLFVNERSDIMTQLNLINLTEEDLRIVRCIQPLIAEHIDEMVAAFYGSVLKVNKLHNIIETHSTVDRLRDTLKVHLTELFSGVIDEQFVSKRLRIAQVHLKIGLEPKWYMGAFQHLFNIFIELLHDKTPDADERFLVIRTVSKLLNFEQQLVLEAYEEENLNQKQQQYNEIKEMLKGKIASLTQALAALTEETNASVEELIASSAEIHQSVNINITFSRQTHELANLGTDKMHELNDQITFISNCTGRMEQTVQQLSQSSRQISKIISLVENIAKQINMLSINASIEAKRAGDYGRGFSVVASEVQRLAVDTKNTVSRINELVAQSNRYALDVTEAINEVTQAMINGKAKAVDTRNVFDNIKASMDYHIEKSLRVGEEMNALVQVIEQIGDSTNQVALSAEALNQTTVDL
ncbi:chemotaxis protein [Paenibacillus albiflavus]|uniref:Chemotaxis protein n=1 Tax=Paenibacillus albiflavus TaxID=2545760 RepID=A0A4R4E970_9BACL|nr:globin-coupled sensor protein [Paenibacillus albiflavus]TCZ76376.1 chemotaxis protein [Paenibacillus albiflavus]